MLKYLVGAVLIVWCVPAAASAADSGRSRGRTPAAPADYRLRASPAGQRATIVDTPGSPFHTGFGGSMVALYPFAGSGIHISAGGRLTGRRAAPQTSEIDTARLLGAPRLGGRAGRRSRPAALVGIDQPVGHGLAIGLDGGATLGRIDSSPGRLARLHMGQSGGGGGRGEGRLNQIARLTALYRF